jgi:hypothetical protein
MCQVFRFDIYAIWPLVQNGYLTNAFTNVNSLKWMGKNKQNHPSHLVLGFLTLGLGTVNINIKVNII